MANQNIETLNKIIAIVFDQRGWSLEKIIIILNYLKIKKREKIVKKNFMVL